MGSLCKSGPATTTSSSTSSYTPTGLSQMNDIWGRVSSAAATPYTPYTGQMVADVNQTQRGGIDNIVGATNYLDTAGDYARQGAQDIDPDQIAQYYNPFQRDVIEATQRNFAESNAQQDERLKGNAISAGAWGGDRAGIARAELMRQQKLAQDPVIAGQQAQGFNLALSAAQADRAAKAQGGYQFGALSNAALGQGQAQIGAGSLEQGTDQAKLAALYQQFQQQQAFPYQQAQFLASTGLPVASAMGGTQKGNSQSQQQAAQPSPLSQIIGAGTAIAGLATGNPFMAMGGAGSMFGGGGGGGFDRSNPMNNYASFGPTYFSNRGGRIGMNRGGRAGGGDGFIDRVHSIRQMLRHGGPVIDMGRGPGGSYSMRGYADGGEVDTFGSRFGAADDAIMDGTFDPQGANYYTPGSLPPPMSAPMASAMPVRSVPTQSFRPPMGLPPQITNPGGGGGEPIMLPPSAMGYDGAPPPRGGLRAPVGLSPVEQSPPFMPGSSERDAPSGPFGLSQDARMGLIAAGLGMMSSKSPNALGAIGEGGLAGLKHYTETKNSRERNELAARKLIQDAEQFAQGIDVRREGIAESRRYHDIVSADRRDIATQRAQDRRIAAEAKAEAAREKKEAGKSLPTAAIKQLTEAGGIYSDFTRLADTWKDEYGGKTAGIVGDTQNLIGRNIGAGYGEQAQWWQDYQEQKNQVRHKLFGSALTATEKAEFDKANINPGMTPEAIATNLKRQKAAAERAARKLATAYQKSGYNSEAVEAAVGVPLSEIGAGADRGVVTPRAATPAGGGKTPPRPTSVPPGSAYSASRNAWRTPDGQIIPHPAQ